MSSPIDNRGSNTCWPALWCELEPLVLVADVIFGCPTPEQVSRRSSIAPPAGEILGDNQLAHRSEDEPRLTMAFKEIYSFPNQVTPSHGPTGKDVPKAQLGHGFPNCRRLRAPGFSNSKDFLVVTDRGPWMSRVEIDATSNCKQPVGSLPRVLQPTSDLAVRFFKVPTPSAAARQQLRDGVVGAG